MTAHGLTDYETFGARSSTHTGVSMCTRLHFGPALPGETQRYLRFAYSGLTPNASRRVSDCSRASSSAAACAPRKSGDTTALGRTITDESLTLGGARLARQTMSVA